MATTGPYRTLADLITETLANLGVLSAGQPADPEDYNYVLEKSDSILRQIAALEIVYVPDPNNIPSQWFAPLADIYAGECATKFGATPDDFMKLKNAGLGGPPGSQKVGEGAAAQALRAMRRGKPTGEVLPAEFF